MEPILVTATLENAYTASDPWSPDLAGILAYWVLRGQLGEEEFALGQTGHRELVEPDLPLEREEWDGTHWWRCSSPVLEVAARFARFEHRRFDLVPALTHLPEKTGRIETKGGPYKAYRNRLLCTVPVGGVIAWHCVGEADEIRRLLRRCAAIGGRRGSGHGGVRGWTVEPGGDPERARFDRPLPLGFAIAHGVADPALPVMRWGIRPPGRVPAHQAVCVMPWREAAHA